MIFKTNYFKNKDIMKTTRNKNMFLIAFIITATLFATMNPLKTNASSNKVIYPLKQVSKLNCRFIEFDKLSSNCKQDLPILNTKDYKKYATLNWWYNDFTRFYTVLWASSYKYGWDVWNGWHIWVDIATSKWTPVYSIADWTVIKSKKGIMEWNLISIKHNINWRYIVSNYLHLSKRLVKVWDKIKVWTKIWEVGSTWNSTWNHLHLQIDLKTPFHPYYYDYNKCPFSYYKISENWLCFDELSKNTIDPLLFLETKWAVLNNIQTTTYTKTNSNSEDLSIFDRTVYIWYSKNDIKKVQEIFKKIWAYNWPISWDYKDIEKSVIAYQIKNKLISNKNTYWAGRFGPKTRYTVKKEYLKLDSKIRNKTEITKVKTTKKIQKISRKNLLSREEIEKREVNNFLKKYKIELNFVNKTANIKKWTTEILKLKVTDKKGKLFKWNMPWSMTFVVNSEKVSIFPTKLFYFKDGKRDIYLKGINEWSTNLYIKVGNVIIKTIPIKVYDSKKTIYADSAKILSPKSIVLWEQKTWVILFKSSDWKNLINIPFWSTFNIKASNDNKICIKKWSLKNVRNIYKAKCKPEEFKNEFNFKYDDTVGWLLIYNFKATDKNFKITVKNNYKNKILNQKNIVVNNPKWLKNSYVYSYDIIDLLKKWIVDWVKQWYFLEERFLTEKDALIWIRNALLNIKNNSYDRDITNKINQNLSKIEKSIQKSNNTKTITRKHYLYLTYEYLIINKKNLNLVNYRDIDETTSKKLSNIFDSQITWKDKFGKNYFRPNEKIKRWEWVYFLARSLDKIYKNYLALK